MIIGDVGGCADQLIEVIGPIVEESGTLVIQVGDLIDRGPNSSAVLAFVRQRLEAGLGDWIQLIGNHESQYLGGEPFWPQQLAPSDAQLLRKHVSSHRRALRPMSMGGVLSTNVAASVSAQVRARELVRPRIVKVNVLMDH
ncbi:metallophosphoesterase [Actinomycetes bacterium KLBMP 9797]